MERGEILTFRRLIETDLLRALYELDQRRPLRAAETALEVLSKLDLMEPGQSGLKGEALHVIMKCLQALEGVPSARLKIR